MARFDDYEEAQRAVDRLSDEGFPVGKLDIVGIDVRLVERVTARLVAGGGGTPAEQLATRVASTRKLLAAAALVMAGLLLTSSFVTALLIPAGQFQPGGAASGRALAYLAHSYLGGAFGTAYDVSTIAILWFAGASAMARLLYLVPRYLPRYGMSPGMGAGHQACRGRRSPARRRGVCLILR